MSKHLTHTLPARGACTSTVAVCFLVFAGCPGDLPGSRYDRGGGGGKDTTLPGDGPGAGNEQGGALQDKGPPTELGLVADTGQPADTGKAPDTAKPPDTAPPPDTALPPDQRGTTVAACPPTCSTGYYCYNKKCRKKCTEGTDICKAITVCGTSEACMPVATNLSVCLAATAPGKGCNASFCGSKHVCASVNGGSFICLRVCSKLGASCGTGGKCVLDQGSKCLFCTKN